MNSENLKILLQDIQKKYPPHYPTKSHDVAYMIPALLESLENAVNYIGFADANIAIKNIISKCLNQFLILAYYNSEFDLEKIKIIEKKFENERKVKIIYNNSSTCIEFIYLSDGTIKVHNNYQFNNSLMGQDYSLTNLSYNCFDPNIMMQSSSNNLYCPYEFISYFSEDGIEERRELKLFLNKDKDKNDTKIILGTIEREEDFISTKINCDIMGDNFKELFPSLEIEQLKNLKEQIIPLSSLGILKKDLNMLNMFLNSSGKYAIRINKDIKDFVISLLHFEEFYDYDCEIDEGKNLIENALILESSNAIEFTFQKPIVHSIYSDIIFNNVKLRCKNKLR